MFSYKFATTSNDLLLMTHDERRRRTVEKPSPFRSVHVHSDAISTHFPVTRCTEKRNSKTHGGTRGWETSQLAARCLTSSVKIRSAQTERQEVQLVTPPWVRPPGLGEDNPRQPIAGQTADDLLPRIAQQQTNIPVGGREALRKLKPSVRQATTHPDAVKRNCTPKRAIRHL